MLILPEPVQTLANHIEHELQHGLWQHCAVYEDELQRLWLLETSCRELRIAHFAVRYGFRLRFYQKGVCAIFEKQPRSAQRTGYRCESRARVKSVRRLSPKLPPGPLPAGLTVTERLGHTTAV